MDGDGEGKGDGEGGADVDDDSLEPGAALNVSASLAPGVLGGDERCRGLDIVLLDVCVSSVVLR